MNITILDVILLGIGLTIIIKVSFKGFIAEFFSMAAFLIGVAVAFRFYRLAAVQMRISGLPPVAIRIIAFFALFISVFLAIKLIEKFAAAIFENEILRSLDHALGFFLGIFEAYIIVLIVLVILELQPFVSLNEMLHHSIIAQLMAPLPIDSDRFLQVLQNAI